MRQTRQAAESNQNGLAATGMAKTGLEAAGLTGVSVTERQRVEAVVESLANLRGHGENLAEVAHDTRNMVTALGLYCDLLEEPGVLYPEFHHYAGELRLVATASRRLVEKMLALDARIAPDAGLYNGIGANWTNAEAPTAGRLERARHWDLLPPVPIDNLATELEANRNLLSALAGPSIALTVDVEGGALAVRLTSEELTRILVNLVKNAAEAVPATGKIIISLHEFHAGAKHTPRLVLTVIDNGPGIPVSALENIFTSGYTTHYSGAHGTQGPGPNGRPSSHRGLGLSITRSIIETAGGSIHATNRVPSGACFKIELPVRSR